jgi:hypothetical protein
VESFPALSKANAIKESRIPVTTPIATPMTLAAKAWQGPKPVGYKGEREQQEGEAL